VADLLGRQSFVGRGRELARLRATFDRAVSTRTGRTVIVGGEAGIGKTRLVARFCADLGSSVRILEGACLEVSGETLPYAPFVEILREIVRDAAPGRVNALLGPGRGELTLLLPEVAARAADLDRPAELDRASRARLFELVLGVLERLAADQPVVLIVEDLQWADRSTRELLAFLARALRDDLVLLVLTARTEGLGAAEIAFIAELGREDDVERLELRPFDRDEVGEQVSALLDEPPAPGVVDQLFERSDGNPFYVEELILADSAGEAPLPPVLQDVLAARVAGLSPRARDILRAAAAAGRRIDDDLLAAALSIPVRELAPALREAVASGILLRLDGPDVSGSVFRHALLREAVNAELFPGERMELHAAFAEALERRLAGGDAAVAPVEIAGHWDAARRPGRALPFTIQGATAAEQVYAFAEASHLWERAAAMFEALPDVSEVGRYDVVEVLLHAAECSVLTGEPGHATDLAQRALVHLSVLGDPERSLLIENRLRWYLWWAGRRETAMAALQAALPGLAAASPLARARGLAQQAGILMFAGRLAESAAFAREAIGLARSIDAPGEVALAHGVLGWDLALLGEVDAGIAEFRTGQAIAERLGSVEGMALAATQLAALLDRVGRSQESLEAARSGYAITERYGVSRMYGALLLGYAAKAELALGRWADADHSTALGLRRGAVDAGAVWLQIHRARLLVGRGEFLEAQVLLARARGIEERLGGTEFSTALLAAEAELAVWSEQHARAIAIGQAGLAALERGIDPDPSLAWLAALVLRAIADAAQQPRPAAVPDAGVEPETPAGLQVAARIEAAVEAYVGRSGPPLSQRVVALLALLNAEADRVRGRASAAAWSTVAERWAVLSRPFQVAYARFRGAEAVLSASGDRAAAGDLLAEAFRTARDLGAVPLAEGIGRLARRARVSLPTIEARPTDGALRPYEFTPREAEVLRLVAAGWTNRQIGDALFITRKTASVHVSNILGKLGVANRGEAAALAHQLGLAMDEPVAARSASLT
jgi:DNA-binding NarL/FixJ family response regulator/tetratricopeptide (TPR) repeat protein